MLELRRDHLQAYARRHDLRWVEDPANLEQRFERNFIRHRILPLLTRRWPAFSGNVSRTARHCGEARAILEEMGALDIETVQVRATGALGLGPLLRLSGPRQRNLVRYWIARQNLPAPASKQLEELFRSLVHARVDRRPHLGWPGAEIRRYRDAIYAMTPLQQVPHHWRVPIVMDTRVEVPGGGMVELQRDSEGGICCGRLSGRRLEIGFRRGGGRLRLRPGGMRRSLKNLFQEAGIPPWVRERTPILFADSEIVAVAGLWTNAEFGALTDRVGVMLRWQKEPPFDRLASVYG
jgi:tRNA(Ile)-lysidine synthase